MAKDNGNGNGGDFDKAVQYPVSMPDSYWVMLDWIKDQMADTTLDRSKMVRICVEDFMHRFLLDNDPQNKKNRAFFKRAYRTIRDEDS